MYDPSSKDKEQIWLQIAKYRPKTPLKGDISLKARFYMPRPKHHFQQSAGKPTSSVKKRHLDIKWHSRKPDLDNLLKLICDTIQGKERMIGDDSQICSLQAEKLYGEPRSEITIQEIH